MLLVFTRSNNITSLLIRLVTWSKWSHVAMVRSDIDSLNMYTETIDSTFLNKGVNKRPLIEVLESATHWAYVEVPVENEDLAWRAAESQIGKPYDVTALVGILLHRKWGSPVRWFCNELAEWCIEMGGSGRFIEDATSRITPQHSWMLKTPKLRIFRNKREHIV